MDQEMRYAVLIDAENISPKYIKIVMDEISNYGITTYRRIYGDWTSNRNNSWKDILLENSITPIQQYSYTDGKNSSDSALIIDAMDILYSMSVDGFCLVSSDSDFTRLASRLRESGMKVVGMGESKTPKSFISACNTFKYLDILYRNEKREEQATEEKKQSQTKSRTTKKRTTRTSAGSAQSGSDANAAPASFDAIGIQPSGWNLDTGHDHNAEQSASQHSESDKKREEETLMPQTKLSTIRRALRVIIQEGSDEDNWMSSADLGNQLAKRYPDFDVRNYGFTKLTPFVKSLGVFEIERVPAAPGSKKQVVMVRLKEQSDN